MDRNYLNKTPYLDYSYYNFIFITLVWPYSIVFIVKRWNRLNFKPKTKDSVLERIQFLSQNELGIFYSTLLKLFIRKYVSKQL